MVFSFLSLMRQAIFWCHFTEQPIFFQYRKTAELLSANQFFGRNDAKAETPVLWPPHAKS